MPQVSDAVVTSLHGEDCPRGGRCRPRASPVQVKDSDGGTRAARCPREREAVVVPAHHALRGRAGLLMPHHDLPRGKLVERVTPSVVTAREAGQTTTIASFGGSPHEIEGVECRMRTG